MEETLRRILRVVNYVFFGTIGVGLILVGILGVVDDDAPKEVLVLFPLGLISLGMVYVGHRLINWIIVPILPSEPPESPDDGWENKPDDPWGPPKEGGKS